MPPSSAPVPADPFLAAITQVLPDLYAWAHLRVRGDLRHSVDPADLIQEVAVRACQRRDSFDATRGPIRPWLFGIAQRVWLEALREVSRTRGQRRRVGGDSVLDQIAGSVTPITQRVAKDEQVRAAVDMLDTLDDEDRQLVSLLGLEALGHAEAAAVLGISIEACRKRWQRLRERLQKHELLRRFAT